MIDIHRIQLSTKEIQQCVVFSKESAKNQQAIEFGQRTTSARSLAEIARDNLIGKIAEVAFSKMLQENYGLSVPLDFKYYPRGKWDTQDAIINGWRIDIKGTRKGGKWLLIDWNKLDFRQRDNELSHLYFMFSVDWDRANDTPNGMVCYEGTVSLDKLKHGVANTYELLKGSTLPGTHTVLQADNYGIRFEDLSKDISQIIAHISAEPPSLRMTEEYPNPYSGKTHVACPLESDLTQNEAKLDADLKESSVPQWFARLLKKQK